MRELFEQKYKECEKSLFLVAIGYLHNTEDAKDCVQDAVLSAFQGFEKLKNPEIFKTWLTRIVINKCKDFLRKKRYTTELTDDLNVFYDLPDTELEIMDAICKLPSNVAIYITLRFYNDMNYNQAAETLHIPVSTVKYRTKRALNQLKILLEGDVRK